MFTCFRCSEYFRGNLKKPTHGSGPLSAHGAERGAGMRGHWTQSAFTDPAQEECSQAPLSPVTAGTLGPKSKALKLKMWEEKEESGQKKQNSKSQFKTLLFFPRSPTSSNNG